MKYYRIAYKISENNYEIDSEVDNLDNLIDFDNYKQLNDEIWGNGTNYIQIYNPMKEIEKERKIYKEQINNINNQINFLKKEK